MYKKLIIFLVAWLYSQIESSLPDFFVDLYGDDTRVVVSNPYGVIYDSSLSEMRLFARILD